MKPTWYDTLKYWNGKEILRECKDKNRLCVHANVWNACVDKPCEKGSKLLGKEADQFIVDEANAYTKGEKMTNREWLESLSNEMLASEISTRCGLCANQDVVDCGDCVSNITTWLTQEYEPPKKEFTQDQLNKVFRDIFVERRAIGILEIEKLIGELFR